MSRLEIAWPDAGVERVRAARGRLEQAGAGLRHRSLEDRLTAVARTLTLWTAPDSPFRRELADSLGAVSGFHPRTVAEGLESGLRAWDPAAFLACCREELASVRRARTLVPFDWTAVLAGGSIPMPSLLSGLLPLVLGSPVLLRETSQDPVSADLLKRSLSAIDAELAQAFESISFPVEDDAALATLLEAPCVVATGSDETIRAVGSRLAPSQRLIAYGHRFSIAILGAADARDAGRLARVTTELALDIARWDQSGCLSPAVVYLLDVPDPDRSRIAEALAEALERLGVELPRGEASLETKAAQAMECAEARMRAAGGKPVRVLEGASATVILEDTPRARPAPLHRFIRLLPVENVTALRRTLEPFRGHLSTVAISGCDPDASAALETHLAALGVSRLTQPGRLQTPPVDWPHDGLPLLLPLVRLLQSDAFPGRLRPPS